jgi:lysophospholipase L1-like esterase
MINNNEVKTKWSWIKVLMFSIGVIISPNYSHSQQLNAAVFGDSLSAGAMSNSSGLKSAGLKDTRDPLWKLIIKELFVQETHRWADGSHIMSLKRLLARDGIYMKFDNFAELGHTYEDVLVKQVPEAYNKGKIYDAAFVFAGANDLCDRIDLARVQDAMVDTIAAISHISRKIYILPLPRIDMLYETAKDRRTKWLVPAQVVWKLHGICPQLTINGGKNQAYNSGWVSEFNFIVETLAAVTAPQVESVSAIHGIIPDKRYISSVDAFHFSALGQEMVAKAAYRSVRTSFFPLLE